MFNSEPILDLFGLLPDEMQEQLVNHRYDLVKRLRRRLPDDYAQTVNELFDSAWSQDSQLDQFTELGTLAQLLTDELDALATRGYFRATEAV